MMICQRFAMIVALAVLWPAATLCSANPTVFTDATFDLADYSQVSFLDNVALFVSTSQYPIDGNPGDNLQILVGVPSSNAVTSMQGFVNTSFVYDPTTQGALATIDASVDKEFNYDATLNSSFFRPLILQDGNYYAAGISLPVTLGVWLTASQSGLVASDFQLFNFTTGLFDATQHPNFAGDVMHFGIANRFNQTPISSDSTADIRYDNLRLQLNPVPEPSSVMLAVAGFVGLVALGWRRRNR